MTRTRILLGYFNNARQIKPLVCKVVNVNMFQKHINVLYILYYILYIKISIIIFKKCRNKEIFIQFDRAMRDF